MSADISGTDPLTGSALKVPAVLGQVKWEVGAKDPVMLNFQVSNTNAQLLKTYLFSTKPDPSASVSFIVYVYDAVSKQYFKYVYSNAPLSCALTVTGKDINLPIASDRSTEVASPVNFAVRAILIPNKTNGQNINIASGSKTTAIAKPWSSD